MKAVLVGDIPIALYCVEGAYYATSNICTHSLAFLTEGWLEGMIIECPLHAGQFDIRTGEGQGAPINCDLATFPARSEAGEIEILLG